MEKRAMIYLILPRGNMFGWGLCGKYLVKEIAALTDIKYITKEFNVDEIGDELDFHFLGRKLIKADEVGMLSSGALKEVDFPILQAIPNHTLEPWLIHLGGSFKAGYTFFERDVLTPEYIQNGKTNFDLVITGSSWCEEVLRNHGLTDVKTVIQGIDPQLFNPSHSEKGYFNDQFVIFSGGKFELRKGQDIVIKAFKVLQDRHSDVMLVNCWYNPWPEIMKTMQSSPYAKIEISTDNYQNSINKILIDNQIDLSKVITMMPRPNAQMARIYKNTDIGLFTNRCEGGTNLVLMEYMACGKPVIASYSSGHKDILAKDNSIIIEKMKQFIIESADTDTITWDDPDLEETISHLEWSYQHRDEIKSIGEKAGSDLAKLTWAKSGREFFELLTQKKI